MGTSSSKHCEAGVLQGAYAPPLPDAPIPDAPEGGHEHEVVIPRGKKKGESFPVEINGQTVTVAVPKGKHSGDTIMYRDKGQIEKVVASTLPIVPGFVIVQSKPVIWATSSLAFFKVKWNDQKENLSMAKSVGELMQEAQEMLLSKAIDLGCNAVLGMTINVTTDSGGSEGNSKLVIVTLCGTPCSIAPANDLPSVNTELIVEPLYLNKVV